jgi:hypothetical protein
MVRSAPSAFAVAQIKTTSRRAGSVKRLPRPDVLLDLLPIEEFRASAMILLDRLGERAHTSPSVTRRTQWKPPNYCQEPWTC